MEVGKRKERVQLGCVLLQPPIANLAEAPLVLSGAVWSLRGRLSGGAPWARELFYCALAMEPAPTNFEAVANHMFANADEGEKGAIHT